MKQFEMPVIELEMFSAEEVMTDSMTSPGEDETPLRPREVTPY